MNLTGILVSLENYMRFLVGAPVWITVEWVDKPILVAQDSLRMMGDYQRSVKEEALKQKRKFRK